MASKRTSKISPYDEGLQRIEAVRKQGKRVTDLDLGNLVPSMRRGKVAMRSATSTELDLGNLTLAKLLPAIEQFEALKTLDLRGNLLTTLPPEICQFKALNVLWLYDNQLTTLPPEIGQLKALMSLSLTANQLTTLPPEIGQLNALTKLRIDRNQLTMLPSEIGRLKALTEFVLGSNQLTTLPPEIGRLTALTELHLNDNQLTMLPPEIGRLTALSMLDLRSNQLKMLPPEIGQLTALTELRLFYNQLTTLPQELYQLTKLRTLFLSHNPALGLPADVLETFSPRAILDHYFGRQKRGAKPLNEVKLLLVGHGRVGKTSLGKALRGVPHDKNEVETPGIERNKLELTAGKTKLTAHVWDFGGQEFLHQTHQFFFSERSIYVVVLAGRDRSLMQRSPVQEAEYWLRLIRTYGTGSPVVIVLNKFQAHTFTVDEFDLKDRYPEVQAVVAADCDPHHKIPELKTLLGKLAAKMPGVREKIDPAWAKVREKLEHLPESFVSYAEYQQICVKQGVTTPSQQESLATILNCLGIALNYRDDPRLRDTSVLKPRWLVDGIYTILRWLQKKQTNGELRIADFPKALTDKETYPADKHQFLLDLMGKFELCFPLEGKGGTYLVPGLLGENQPKELKQFMAPAARRIQFRYDDVRPPGLLPQFIVRSHTLSVRQPRWLRGVVLVRAKAKALVRADHDGRVTDVFALGAETADRVWLTEFILAEMKSLHDKLPVRTFVESEDEPGAWTELEILREADKKGEATRTEQTTDRGTVKIAVNKTLREVESSDASQREHDPLPLFICYAHADERLVKHIKPSLTVLARRGYIVPFRDTDLIAGEDWDETIQERLSNARIILFMVSRHFLASKYITEDERPLAMKLKADKQAVVIPVLLSKCSWDVEDFARLEMLPNKDRLLTSYNPHETGWALVEEGVMKAIKQLQADQPKADGKRLGRPR